MDKDTTTQLPQPTDPSVDEIADTAGAERAGSPGAPGGRRRGRALVEGQALRYSI